MLQCGYAESKKNVTKLYITNLQKTDDKLLILMRKYSTKMIIVLHYRLSNLFHIFFQPVTRSHQAESGSTSPR